MLLTQSEIIKLCDDLLEKELARYTSLLGKGKTTIHIIGEIVEAAYRHDFESGENMRQALDILIPLVNFSGDDSHLDVNDLLKIDLVLQACKFAGYYRDLRDLIYCSFRDVSAVTWTMNQRKINISLNDKSYFRQLVSEKQTFLINSMISYPENIGKILDEIMMDMGYWEMGHNRMPSLLQTLTILTEIKLAHFFSHLPEDSQVDMGGYSYADFYKVYKSTLLVALYERNWTKLNNLGSVITYLEHDLAAMHAANAEISEKKCLIVLKDLASASQGTFNYISTTKEFLLFPTSYSLIDHIAGMLKQYAKRNQKGFSAGCAQLIGDSLVNKVLAYFVKYPNFKVFKDISLQKYDPKLPDIDISAVSYEPSFGFQFIICEVKNNLPASWVKEHLKLSDKKGAIPKAVQQLKLLSMFLQEKQGQQLLYDLIMRGFNHLDFKKLFPNGFMVSITFLIITPQNIGMLASLGETKIINADFLKHLVDSSDGDSIYIKQYLTHLNKILDDSYTVQQSKFNLKDYQVSFDIGILKHIISFGKNEYLSSGLHEKYEQDALKDEIQFINLYLSEELPPELSNKIKLCDSLDNLHNKGV